MRIVMMGTGPFAVPTFEHLLDSRHDVVALVTRPAVNPRGTAASNPMREVAQRRSVSVIEPDDINSQEARETLARLTTDLLVVCDYGQILKPETLATATLGGINLHGSLLPKYRGAAPVQRAVQAGETVTGVSVIHMTPKLDAGPILVTRTTAIDPDESAADLEPRLAESGVAAVIEAIDMLQNWDRTSSLGTLQNPAEATRAPRLSKAEGAIDWSKPAEVIRNQVRAFKPWPGTFTFWRREKGEPLRLLLDRVRVIDRDAKSDPGTIETSDDSKLEVATGLGVLSLDAVQPAGKRTMTIAEFLRGYPIRVGERFEAM